MYEGAENLYDNIFINLLFQKEFLILWMLKFLIQKNCQSHKYDIVLHFLMCILLVFAILPVFRLIVAFIDLKNSKKK